eukprot:PhF_6_TR13002/c0_g1_i2/m.20588
MGHADPYVKVYYPPTAKEPLLKTSVKESTANPIWDEKFTIKYDGENNYCRLVVMDENMTSDASIGDLSPPVTTKCTKQMFPILDDKRQPSRGQMQISVLYELPVNFSVSPLTDTPAVSGPSTPLT